MQQRTLFLLKQPPVLTSGKSAAVPQRCPAAALPLTSCAPHSHAAAETGGRRRGRYSDRLHGRGSLSARQHREPNDDGAGHLPAVRYSVASIQAGGPSGCNHEITMVAAPPSSPRRALLSPRATAGTAPPYAAGVMVRETGNPAWVTIEPEPARQKVPSCSQCTTRSAAVCKSCAKVAHDDISKLIAEIGKLQSGGGGGGGGGGGSGGGGDPAVETAEKGTQIDQKISRMWMAVACGIKGTLNEAERLQSDAEMAAENADSNATREAMEAAEADLEATKEEMEAAAAQERAELEKREVSAPRFLRCAKHCSAFGRLQNDLPPCSPPAPSQRTDMAWSIMAGRRSPGTSAEGGGGSTGGGRVGTEGGGGGAAG